METEERVVSFQLMTVSIERFSFDATTSTDGEKWIEQGLRYGSNIEEESIIIWLSVKLMTGTTESPSCYADIVLTLKFRIQSFTDVFDIDDKLGVKIPDQLLRSLIAITYSTARGVLLGKGVRAVLPVIDPGSLLVGQSRVTE
jgi:hypothetical protein